MNSQLIPPAILLDNPGITREEFVELLNQTHSTWRDFRDRRRSHMKSKFGRRELGMK